MLSICGSGREVKNDIKSSVPKRGQAHDLVHSDEMSTRDHFIGQTREMAMNSIIEPCFVVG